MVWLKSTSVALYLSILRPLYFIVIWEWFSTRWYNGKYFRLTQYQCILVLSFWMNYIPFPCTSGPGNGGGHNRKEYKDGGCIRSVEQSVPYRPKQSTTEIPACARIIVSKSWQNLFDSADFAFSLCIFISLHFHIHELDEETRRCPEGSGESS